MSLLALWSFPMLTCKMAPSATGTRHRSMGICQWNSRIKEENITGQLKATAAWEMAAAAAAFPTNPFDLTLDWTVSRCVPHSVHRHADFRWSSPLLFGTCPGTVPSQRMSYHMEAHLPCPQRYTDTLTHWHTDTHAIIHSFNAHPYSPSFTISLNSFIFFGKTFNPHLKCAFTFNSLLFRQCHYINFLITLCSKSNILSFSLDVSKMFRDSEIRISVYLANIITSVF